MCEKKTTHLSVYCIPTGPKTQCFWQVGDSQAYHVELF